MYYKNFEHHITRKHGIIIEGWPLYTSDNPSVIGSQVELKVLLSSWETGATRFRKMSDEEHMGWLESRAKPEPASVVTGDPTVILFPPPQHSDPSLALAMDPPVPRQPFNIINFESTSVAPAGVNSTSSTSKQPRKTRSNKGKPRKKAKTLQIPGADVFHTDTM